MRNHHSPPRRQQYTLPAATLLTALCLLSTGPLHAATPTVAEALKLKPVQPKIDYDLPTQSELAKCTLKVVKGDGEVGWVVRDPQGQMLRRFVDSNSDNVVDRWCYYHGGVEVYRDVDSDFNRKADQHRWLNTAGRRWALDRNEDGRIDSWKAISAQEATSELVAAVATRDVARFRRLLLTSAELKSLGLGKAMSSRLDEKTRGAEAQFRRLVSGGTWLNASSKWVHFSAPPPGVFPAGTEGSTRDVIVHENVVAMVEVGKKQGIINVGTLVQAGDSWKLIDAPSVPRDPTAQTTSHGFFFQIAASEPPESIGGGPPAAANAEMQKLLTALEETQKQMVSVAESRRGSIHKRQAEILEQLYERSTDRQQRSVWGRQLADAVGAAVQAGEYPGGMAKLDTLAKGLAGSKSEQELAGYVIYRRLLAQYSVDMQDPKADFAKIQTRWLKTLEKFVDDFPRNDDAAEAMLQLAMANEFSGEEDTAKKWYRSIVSGFRNSAQAKKAAGALRRLDIVGKPLDLSGKTIDGRSATLTRYRGRLVVVQYWASWCEPCKEDMDDLRDLVAKYGKKGFTVLGVNVDNDAKDAASFLKGKRVPWAHIHESGGLESRPAVELGVLTLPTMLLIDERGKVVNRSIHVAELESECKKRLR